LWLVLASLFVAMLASYTALDMAGRVAGTKGRAARLWLIGGSVAMGIGIWSMHFVGMLSFSLPMRMGYDPLITLLSLLIAIASSAFALWMVCQQQLSTPRLLVGSLVMGAGVCSMHYTGMAAMRMHPGIRYIPSLFLLSILIAVTASGAALWIAFHLRQRSPKTRYLRAGAAVVMGLAIAGMHYTGMAAAQFPKGSTCAMARSGLSSNLMAPVIVTLSLAVLSIALIVSMLDFRMETRTAVLSSSLDRANDELRFLALHDALTKLPNRILLEDRMDQELENAKRNLRPFSVLFLDLDGFKQINDAFGHDIGDRLLVEVAQRISATVRSRDTVARLGGDEFVVLADSGSPADIATLAGKLIAAIQEPFAVNGHDCEVTASIGIAVYKGDETARHELLKNADAAMYHAKALGRNTYSFFEVSMNKDTRQQLEVLHDLRHALGRRELVLYYQPKFDARSGEMLGAEALLRWKHPTRGLVMPGEFIPLAEKIGLIIPIGEWTLQEACRQLSEWQAAGHRAWTVAVNLSATQFNHRGLPQLVQQCLDRCGVPPENLTLEITESTAMLDPESTVNILRRLREMGVRISIDDFGAGHSSLLYLKRLPAEELKIDKGFVKELSRGSDDAAIISAIVALGRTLSLEIVAEGVETVEQREFLTSLGCSSLQGFLLGRPMPPEQLVATVSQESAVWGLREMESSRGPRLVEKLRTAV
jgi:diguanylate cyclase (GGDEF)-like protein